MIAEGVSAASRVVSLEVPLVVRMKGTNEFVIQTKPGTVMVAGKSSIDVPPGTLNSALKQAGLKKAH